MSVGGQIDRKKQQSGQLIIEYVLLLLVAVAMATVLQNTLLGGTPDDPENAGLINQAIFQITTVIARDTPGG